MATVKDKDGRPLHVGDKVIATFNDRTKVVDIIEMGHKILTVRWDTSQGQARQARVPARKTKKFTVSRKKETQKVEVGGIQKESAGKLIEGMKVVVRAASREFKHHEGKKGYIQTFTEQGNSAVVLILGEGEKSATAPNIPIENLKRLTKNGKQIFYAGYVDGEVREKLEKVAI